jgi:(2Fe-2S) ferredoxin
MRKQIYCVREVLPIDDGKNWITNLFQYLLKLPDGKILPVMCINPDAAMYFENSKLAERVAQMVGEGSEVVELTLNNNQVYEVNRSYKPNLSGVSEVSAS